jgi:hypothetical protein
MNQSLQLAAIELKSESRKGEVSSQSFWNFLGATWGR